MPTSPFWAHPGKESRTHNSTPLAELVQITDTRPCAGGIGGVRSCRILGITPVEGDAAGMEEAQLSIPWEILTPGKPRIQDRPLAANRIPTTARILTRTLVLARILTGTPMPARTLTRIKFVRTLNRIIILARILTGILMLTRIPIGILTHSRIVAVIPILA